MHDQIEMREMGQENGRRYWLWVTTPEYYEEYDGSDREILEPGNSGTWTCHNDTRKGDLILLYRAKKRKDFAYIIRAEKNAEDAPDDYQIMGKGWTHTCTYKTRNKFKKPITLQDLRVQRSFFRAQWKAYRMNFMGTAFEIPSDVWDRLISIAIQKNPDEDLESLLDREQSIESIVESDLDSLQAEEFGQDYYAEGGIKRSYMTRYERDPKLRVEAIKIHGTKCQVCGFDFGAVYGSHGRNFIEVHHKVPVSSLEEKTRIVPRTDMAVVCSNCHRMIHRKRDHILSLSEMEYLIDENRSHSKR